MAVANTKSTQITNADATGTSSQSFNAATAVKGNVYLAQGVCATAAADDDGSVYRFVRLPSNAIVHSIRVFNPAITGSTDWNFGLYQTAANGGADADENVFADAVDVSSGLAGTEVRFEIAAVTTANQRLWELLGASADTKRDYDLCGTAVTVGSGVASMLVQVLWSV